MSSALTGAYAALSAKGDVPVCQGLVVVSMVVVQRWYRERLVGDAVTMRGGARGVRGDAEGVQYDIINCSTMPPACRHGGHEEPGLSPGADQLRGRRAGEISLSGFL